MNLHLICLTSALHIVCKNGARVCKIKDRDGLGYLGKVSDLIKRIANRGKKRGHGSPIRTEKLCNAMCMAYIRSAMLIIVEYL